MWKDEGMNDRWDRLFADIEIEHEAHVKHMRAGLGSDTLAETFAELTYEERLAGCMGQPVTMWIADTAVTGHVRRVGRGWAVLTEGRGDITLVFLAHVSRIRTASRIHARSERGGPGMILRAWVRERVRVRLDVGAGFVEGDIHAVAADYVHVRVDNEFDVVPIRAIRLVRVMSERQ